MTAPNHGRILSGLDRRKDLLVHVEQPFNNTTMAQGAVQIEDAPDQRHSEDIHGRGFFRIRDGGLEQEPWVAPLMPTRR